MGRHGISCHTASPHGSLGRGVFPRLQGRIQPGCLLSERMKPVVFAGEHSTVCHGTQGTTCKSQLFPSHSLAANSDLLYMRWGGACRKKNRGVAIFAPVPWHSVWTDEGSPRRAGCQPISSSLRAPAFSHLRVHTHAHRTHSTADRCLPRSRQHSRCGEVWHAVVFLVSTSGDIRIAQRANQQDC